ncbi:hypothetical protein EMIHUDRAFT_424489 [Emiliania huxleyi CCMP1516]|uniref:Uncharacterized protein n=3 Tax=Emiliania huxleyi TaxID=2903 RepID=A0A0D3JJN2_EMIH1|nr:hypothetical protein EMIHUDRAFT_432038 [Emiliania huxleyi CCMP1516]XP_005776146.1 hypothetical protein EMIHUDRAFT_424489 [Emiliania huxleyi CCMP1516]EOD22775.1 hypothetical protein EMIHUDRAFT_432038 [Emiliania huxleyi CCMP1516]EOD23717.1 hypothetical protein EMIHUDRAFT_424489 [Emiliania huxleyi CCMP1516]|eukprot:XP_005775204.1 hypothetical protein EMIHUDRAFT_432038 [Emiliania huxleyi CCMP1516]
MQAKYGSILYNTVGVLPFGLMSAEMLPEVWKGIATETCKTGFGGGKTCTEALEFTVGKVYLQVICGSALFYAMHLLLEGKSALLASMAMLIGTMGKHILVDDLMPPPPVMAMVALTVALILLAPAAWGRRAYIGFCVVNAATFLLDPLTVITDSFPAVEAGSPAAEIGTFEFEVVALYFLCAAVTVASPSKAYGLAYSCQMGCALLLKHILVNKSGPPAPMVALYAVTSMGAWYEVGWADFPKPLEEAMQAGPIVLHGLIVFFFFVPYFALETVGISLPYVGLAHVDESYTHGGSTLLMTGMLAIFSAMTSYDEMAGCTSAKMFAAHHYFLSLVVFFWQVQPTTTAFGAAFGSVPHLFTAWTCYLVLSKTKQD